MNFSLNRYENFVKKKEIKQRIIFYEISGKICFNFQAIKMTKIEQKAY